MSAPGMNVRAYATRQFERKEAADQARAAAEEAAVDRSAEELEEARARAMDLLERSPLEEWFPGAPWEWYHWPVVGPDSPTLFTSGRRLDADPFETGVPVFMLDEQEDGPVGVRIVLPAPDGSLRGRRVFSVVDVGRVIRETLDPWARLEELRAAG